MKKIEEITRINGGDVKSLNKELLRLVKSDDEQLNEILDFVFDAKGKQVRAHMVYLSAGIFGKANSKTQLAAILVQLLHTSTLIHDDVVDEAELRRGRSTVNAIWKNKIAILTGDYMFARALSIATERKAYDLLEILTPTISEMSIGEIIQMQEIGNKKFSESVYYDIIYRKTAVLISASAQAGALSSGAGESEQMAMKELGKAAGMAFQIQDDILDFTANGSFGKTRGKDIEEKKYTLPLIHALDKAPENEKKMVMEMINKGVNKKEIREIIRFIETYQGFDYAREKMQAYVDRAHEILKQFPQNKANSAMSELLKYFTQRKK